ncbi:protein THYLAKOID FORMATION1, chloroplastic isoform X2 [Populus trichocarpa]|uniref:Protein THYLAKOID FORMATION1, chloroplastic n=1 Tax=Populus trichocarpa TaxID=3694 RepID=A0A3N7GCU5_POPTR|nr:protein THYLAKOID FORMATION1, chloroplastic isoform X2 [Populus trichocarpa]|eukprot:XP_024446578.1 protein THYLAKOID FORMATION1, chloroplastic isoform X2 [Populus trichocarpa]
MAAVTPVSFSAISQSSSDRRAFCTVARNLGFEGFRFRSSFSCHYVGVRASNSTSHVPPTVADTKLNFLKAYKRPIPSIYNTVLQELIVQQHLMKYKKTFRYDPVFGLGFVTVYDQLMEGYPSDEDREAIFQAYIKALEEDPEQYRIDAKKLEEWARAQTPSSLVDFSSREGEIEGTLKDIAERVASGNFSYSRFFAVGLFRLLELSNASEPTVLEKLCSALNINKRSVDRDLDVYRGLLSKLVQARELLKEYVDREKKKQEERAESQKASETVTKCLGEPQFVGQ